MDSSIKRWPLHSYLELGALPGAVTSARLHARLVVSEWGLERLADDVELVVSELVTNAVQASQALTGWRWRGVWRPGIPPVRVWLQGDQAGVLVQVWDGCERMPEWKNGEAAGGEAEGGRGLVIVGVVCRRFGVYGIEETGGKVVWGMVAS